MEKALKWLLSFCRRFSRAHATCHIENCEQLPNTHIFLSVFFVSSVVRWIALNFDEQMNNGDVWICRSNAITIIHSVSLSLLFLTRRLLALFFCVCRSFPFVQWMRSVQNSPLSLGSNNDVEIGEKGKLLCH